MSRLPKTAPVPDPAAPVTMELASGALAEVLPAPTGMTRETYTPEKIAAIMWRVASGEGVKAACAAEGVHFTTLYYWLLRSPELERMWRAARRLSAQSLFDEALDQVRKLTTGHAELSGTSVRALDVAQSALRGMAEVMNPSEFSNRQAVSPPVLVKIVTTLNLNPGSDVREGTQEDVYTVAARVIGDGSVPEDGIEATVPRAAPGNPTKRKSTGQMVQHREAVDG